MSNEGLDLSEFSIRAWYMLKLHAFTWVKALTVIGNSSDCMLGMYMNVIQCHVTYLCDLESDTGRLIHRLELKGTLMWTEVQVALVLNLFLISCRR